MHSAIEQQGGAGLRVHEPQVEHLGRLVPAAAGVGEQLDARVQQVVVVDAVDDGGRTVVERDHGSHRIDAEHRDELLGDAGVVGLLASLHQHGERLVGPDLSAEGPVGGHGVVGIADRDDLGEQVLLGAAGVGIAHQVVALVVLVGDHHRHLVG